MIKLVLIDVDGTLYGPDGVHPRVWESADRARARGLHLAICTGRSGAGVALDYARRLDPDGLHIFDGGAVILGGDGVVHHSARLDAAAYAELLAIARASDFDVETYTAEGGYFIERETPDLVAHQEVLGRRATVMPLDRVPGTVARLQFVVQETPAWQATRPRVRGLPGLEMHEATSPTLGHIVFASVTPHGASKLSAAGWIARRFGLDGLARVAMVGDGENDLELIRAAGLGIAMGNAPAHVQAAADRIVGRVEHAGLADALDALG
ncbi:MAG: HAD family phosphatase [Alphaproteobacteria bacterium]|nr:HAD family phosphatase [Alphaproteobacteria bacterium]